MLFFRLLKEHANVYALCNAYSNVLFNFNALMYALKFKIFCNEHNMHACSFGAVIFVGDQRSWITTFRNYPSTRDSAIKTNIVHKRLQFDIHQIGGIDFIFPKINLNEIDDVRNATRSMKDFIEQRRYLEVRMLFLFNYMSPKTRQVLICLSAANIDTTLVSFMPGLLTEALYLQVCSYLNVRTKIVSSRCLDDADITSILENIFDDSHLIELFASFRIA